MAAMLTTEGMRFDPPLVRGRLIRRYKRFMVDVALDDGPTVTAHCTNTGSLAGCLREGAPVLLERASNPSRKLAWTWKMIRLGRTWVGVDTGLAVPLVQEAIGRGRLPELAGYCRIVREVAYGREGRSRIDLLLSRGGQPAESGAGRRPRGRELFVGDERVYVEVKNTTLALQDGAHPHGAFPDAVTERGLKHLHELMHVVEQGHRAAMVYCVQRSDVRAFRPADEIDPAYGRGLRQALEAGVEVYALSTLSGPRRVSLSRRLPLEL